MKSVREGREEARRKKAELDSPSSSRPSRASRIIPSSELNSHSPGVRILPMRHFSPFLLVLALISAARAQTIKKDIPYAGEQDEKRTLDVYSPADAKDLPVVFWIHGGGWQAGDKSDVKLKPQWFMGKGFVFVSINYRLWPAVEMGTLIRDCA